MAWIVLFLDRGGLNVAAHWARFGVAAPASLVMGWAAMLVAMTSPVLIGPICHIRLRSFADRRARSVALLVCGYAAVWRAMSYVLCAVALVRRFFAPKSKQPLAGIVALNS